MKCPRETRENAGWLLDYTSGRLDAEAAAALEKHMEDCPACREFVSGQQAVWKALDAWEASPVSMDFDRRLHQRIEQHVSWWERLTRPLRPLVPHHAMPMAAAAGVLILAGVLLERPAVTPTAPRQESAKVEALRPDQVEHALDDMEMLGQFNRLVRPDTAEPKM
ncbi:MAG TPA: zf-HC2 domain-containing protein [Bryobacteraceae bacterium]|nr:zf-HC2 domain-containing protein [Bryobacteraceae bacterium]